MKLGITSYAYRWALSGKHPFIRANFKLERPLTVFGLVEKVSKLGLKVLQICENVDLNLTNECYERLGEFAKSKGITLELGADGINLSTLNKYAEIADLTGSHLLRVYPKKQEPLQKLVDRIRRFLSVLRDQELTLAIENSSLCLYTSNQLVEMFKQINDPLVGACIDVANSLGLLEKPLETVETLSPYAVSIHIKDFKIQRKRIGGFEILGVPLGKGMLDVNAVLDMIEKSNRNANILLEQWMERKDTIKETLEEEEKWLMESIKFLSSFHVYFSE